MLACFELTSHASCTCRKEHVPLHVSKSTCQDLDDSKQWRPRRHHFQLTCCYFTSKRTHQFIEDNRNMQLAFPFLIAVSCADAFSVRTDRLRQSSALFSGMPENPLDGGELLSTLASLDREWKAQQLAEGDDSRWSKVVLPSDRAITSQEEAYEQMQNFVYLLEPPSGKPDVVISFLGGAGLGQFPQVAYNEFLIRLSDTLNAAVITSAYQVGLDHFAISKQNGDRLQKAEAYCAQIGKFPKNLPTYCLTHSLGGKLQTIYVAATGKKYDGLGFMAFNNFSFSQTMSMAKDFSAMITGQPSGGASRRSSSGGQGDLMSTLFAFGELAVGAIGLDFTPSQAEMNRLIELRYDDDNQKKTRLFVFDSDTLDSSRDFVQDCRFGVGPSLSGLKGNHLTPVYFEESRGGATPGNSFGKEQDLQALVDEVSGWINGKDPTRRPNW
jgi:hypothetical protein